MTIDVKNSISSILLPYKPRNLAVFERDSMIKIPEAHLKAVVFLCVDKREEGNRVVRTPRATGFFVRVPVDRDVWTLYLVTARHCIDGARPYGKLYLRMNLKSGVYIDMETDPDSWYDHPPADVSAIPISQITIPEGVSVEDIDHKSVAIEDFVGSAEHYDYEVKSKDKKGREYTMRLRPEVGHQVFFVGLFAQHYGQERNLPIARFGNISRMPAEVKMKLPGNIEFKGIAYLAEFQAWAGNSGAPVFSLIPYITLDRLKTQDNVTLITDTELLWSCKFLGLLNGHYPIRQEAVRSDYSPEIEIDLNAGMAVVIPAEAIRQLLMEDVELMKQREKIAQEHEKRKPVPMLDFGVAESFTKHDFEDALKRVSRRIKSVESEKE